MIMVRILLSLFFVIGSIGLRLHVASAVEKSRVFDSSLAFDLWSVWYGAAGSETAGSKVSAKQYLIGKSQLTPVVSAFGTPNEGIFEFEIEGNVSGQLIVAYDGRQRVQSDRASSVDDRTDRNVALIFSMLLYDIPLTLNEQMAMGQIKKTYGIVGLHDYVIAALPDDPDGADRSSRELRSDTFLSSIFTLTEKEPNTALLADRTRTLHVGQRSQAYSRPVGGMFWVD